MIAVDTSALMAILLGEPQSDACIAALEVEADVAMSAVNVAEALIVARQRNVADEMATLIDGLSLEILSVTAATARRIAEIYRRWGKGNHPAALNLGDCFSYDVAREYGCGLLYVGGDFSRTDVQSVLEK
jgi:ribonuclease VapC